MIIWFIAEFNKIGWLESIGSSLAALTIISLLGLTLSLPISGLLNLLHHRLEKKGNKAKEIFEVSSQPDRNRRIFLKGAAAALPLATLSTGATGVARAFQDIRVYKITVPFSNLPSALDGFKILHLSDSHLGIYKMLDDWEDILTRANNFKPDIILITGDIADDLNLLPSALKMIQDSNPPSGAFVSLGNHEYYRGIDEVIKIIDKSGIPLLRSNGTQINIGNSSLYISGADDPRYLHQDHTDFFQKTIDKSLENASTDSFKVLMSHRPEGFDYASQTGINLTLSGHTHGGQIGFAGKSFFESFFNGKYLWGKYENGTSEMYISSGIGHWFPFRLGCPPEAPIIELKSV